MENISQNLLKLFFFMCTLLKNFNSSQYLFKSFATVLAPTFTWLQSAKCFTGTTTTEFCNVHIEKHMVKIVGFILLALVQ